MRKYLYKISGCVNDLNNTEFSGHFEVSRKIVASTVEECLVKFKLLLSNEKKEYLDCRECKIVEYVDAI